MSNEEFESAVAECLKAISTLPESERERLMTLVEETRQRHAALKVTMKDAMDSLDDWRVLAKYILFDRDAAAREAQSAPDSDDA